MTRDAVLVVDDNAANAKLLSFVLTRAGYDVEVASNADEAMSALARRPPRLVLMDLQMPGVDGLTLTRRLRDDRAWKDLVIVAVTAYAMVGDREKALAAGCDDYLTKPIDTRALPERVAGYLSSHHDRAGST